MRNLFDLSNRVAVVTGGGTHLGKAMAESLAELGATVYIASRRLEVCEEAAAQIRKRGLRAEAVRVDASDKNSVDAMLSKVAKEQDNLDIMICNAGGNEASSQVPDARLDEFERTMTMNVRTTFLCAQAAARMMLPLRRGSIITVGSIHGFLGVDERLYGPSYQRSGVGYRAAKGAVINLTRDLACELGKHDINVNCISPGQIPLPGDDPETVEHLRLNNPLRRTGLPEDLKGIVALLASDAGRWITGQNIVVDGGWSAW